MRSGPTHVLLVVVIALTCSSAASAFRNPSDAGLPPDFDLRRTLLGTERSADLEHDRQSVVQALEARFGRDIVVRWGDLSSRPQLIAPDRGVLDRLGVEDSPEMEPVARVREFLRGERAVLGLSERDIDGLHAIKSYRTEGVGLTHVVFSQRIDGVPVFEGRVSVNLDRAGGVLNIGGEWFGGLGQPEPPLIGPGHALSIAAEGLGLSGAVPAVRRVEQGPQQLTQFEAGGEYLEPPVARLVIAAAGPGVFTTAWDVSIWESVTGWSNLYQVLIDARSGEPLLRRRLTRYVVDPSQATGVVFEQDPNAAGRVEASFAGDAVASPANWVTTEQTLTTGNNVRARSDRAGTNDPNNPMADGGTNLDFDFRFSDRYATRGQIGDEDAAIANGFYFGNLAHDHFYSLGFDEAAGNFQEDNFGLGGVGGDPVDVDVQDSWNNSLPLFRNNANWSPTVEGSPPRTQYYLFTEPERDSAFDGDVFIHEFAHGLSTRLVGGPGSICLSGAQPGGMGEGWGDFLAVSFFGAASDDPAGPVAVGEYSTGDEVNGVRRFPYAYDMGINPLTYEDLCDGGSCSVHDEGEIWSVTLWDARHDLILVHGFEEGRRRIEQPVVDAMKMSPCNPNFVTMRDLILQSSEQRYGSSDLCVLRSAFARRGLGASASSAGTGSVVEAGFDVVSELDASLTFEADATTLRWDARSDARAYPVARGTFGAGSQGAFEDASCVGESTEASFFDSTVPPVGGGLYYLVSVRDSCETASFGEASDGQVRAVSSCAP